MPGKVLKSYISGVLLQITAKSDSRLVASAVRRILRTRLLIARCLGWALIVLALFLPGAPGRPNFPLLLTGLFLAAVVPTFLVTTGTRQILRDGHRTLYEISDGGVASSSFQTRHAYAWEAFRYVQEAPGQLIFARSRTRCLPVPTAGLTPGQVEQVLGTAAGHGLAVRRA